MGYWIKCLGVITTALVLSFPTIEGLRQGEKLEIYPAFAQDISYSQSKSQSEINRLLKEGAAHYQDWEYQKALKKFQQVLKLRREMGDLAAEGRALFYVGAIYEKLGQIEKAKDYYWEVLGVAEEIVDQTKAKKTNSMLCKTTDGKNMLKNETNQINFDCYEGDSGSVTLLFDEDDKKE